ncbi:MerR family transcriptional regulator [Blautia sp.]|jgi:DNA-binding transcriptional MerR regulator|uniref:MerR family transcriptional regulator n=1 Tax=Blautia sp. TaxID=1955243 RepID=UPI003A4C2AF8
MRTVKQVSEMTGISVRALHYYDQIGLLRPTVCNEAGYRFYDDKALEILRQILFFREFDMPLKEIKAILDSPDYDREQVLRSQKRLLELKMKRLERLISNMNDILKGEDKMDFDVFSKAEIEELYKHMTDQMNESQRQAVREKFGSMEAFKAHYIENASSENVQENFKKVVEWYGDKQAALDASKNPAGAEVVQAYQNRLNDICSRLAAKREMPQDSFEVKSLIGEYEFVSKQLYQISDAEKIMLELADLYRENQAAKEAFDGQYGEGMAQYLAEAIREYFK